jgi:hypothetical protein
MWRIVHIYGPVHHTSVYYASTSCTRSNVIGCFWCSQNHEYCHPRLFEAAHEHMPTTIVVKQGDGHELHNSSYLGRSIYAWIVVHVHDRWPLIPYENNVLYISQQILQATSQLKTSPGMFYQTSGRSWSRDSVSTDVCADVVPTVHVVPQRSFRDAVAHLRVIHAACSFLLGRLRSC